MRLPRDVSGIQLASALKVLEYFETRQSGSHIRLTTQLKGEHHVTVPKHDPIKLGTLAGILDDVASHHGLNRSSLIEKLKL